MQVFVRTSQQYPKRINLPKIRKSGEKIIVNHVVWNGNRVGAAILNFTRFCKCGNCDSCLVGSFVLNPVLEDCDCINETRQGRKVGEGLDKVGEASDT